MSCQMVYSYKYGFGIIEVYAFLYFIYDSVSIMNVNDKILVQNVKIIEKVLKIKHKMTCFCL